MSQLIRAVENLKQYYIERLLEAGLLNEVESNPFSYTLKELEEMIKKVHQT
jgi:hypothetical protein